MQRDTNSHSSAVYNVLFRRWAQRVSGNWNWQNSSDRKLFSYTKGRMRKPALVNNHNQVLMECTAEATKQAWGIDDVIEKLLNPVS